MTFIELTRRDNMPITIPLYLVEGIWKDKSGSCTITLQGSDQYLDVKDSYESIITTISNTIGMEMLNRPIKS